MWGREGGGGLSTFHNTTEMSTANVDHGVTWECNIDFDSVMILTA